MKMAQVLDSAERKKNEQKLTIKQQLARQNMKRD